MIASLCGAQCGGRLFLHVLGATFLFGDVLAVATLTIASLRVAQHQLLLRRLSFLVVLVGVLPSFVLMRVGAQLVVTAEHLDKHSPGWVGVGFAVSDAGIIVLLLLALTSWLSLRRPAAARWAAGLSVLYLVALGVAWFAMSAKPG